MNRSLVRNVLLVLFTTLPESLEAYAAKHHAHSAIRKVAIQLIQYRQIFFVSHFFFFLMIYLGYITFLHRGTQAIYIMGYGFILFTLFSICQASISNLLLLSHLVHDYFEMIQDLKD